MSQTDPNEGRYEKYLKQVKDQREKFLGNPDERDKFVEDVEKFMDKLGRLASKAKSFEEYARLRDMSRSLQRAISSSLNVPAFAKTFPPPEQFDIELSGESMMVFSAGEVHDWIKDHAYRLGVDRIRERVMYLLSQGHLLYDIFQSTSEEQYADWYNGSIYFATDVLDGKISFAHQVLPGSYVHLARVWLKDVKRLKAYFRWLERGKRLFDTNEPTCNYFEACKEIRDRLVNKSNIRCSEGSFGPVKDYLERDFLKRETVRQTGLVVDLGKDMARQTVEAKAYQLFVSTGESDAKKNWTLAWDYVAGFYGSIIPAVVDDNPLEVCTVLEAIRKSEVSGHKHSIMNCFEAAVAIYFLSSDSVRQFGQKEQGVVI